LVGVAGVIAAPLSGFVVDKRGPYFSIGVGVSEIREKKREGTGRETKREGTGIESLIFLRLD
jgi:hypothetical protein